MRAGKLFARDMLGLARELEENAALFREDKAAFDRLLSAVIALRAIPAAFVIDLRGNLISAATTDGIDLQTASARRYFPGERDGQIVPMSWDLANGVAAIKKLNGFDNAFVYALRPVNPNAFRLLVRTQV